MTVINTKKGNMEDALSYTEYILAAISNHALYRSIVFRFTQAWEALLWRDKVLSINYHVFMSITLIRLSSVALITSVTVVSPCIYGRPDGDKSIIDSIQKLKS